MRLTRLYLLVSAAVLLLVGAMLSFSPETLYNGQGAPLSDNIVLLSDLRSAGALLLVLGFYVLIAPFRDARHNGPLLISALAYLGYGLGRLVSMGFDGPPNAVVGLATGLEWVLGVSALVLLWRRQSRPASQEAART